MRISRRTLLRAAAGVAVTAGSATIFGESLSAAAPVLTRAGDRPVPWHLLGRSLRGTLVLPQSPSYASDAHVYNERFDRVLPDAVAYCAAPEDVQRCVDFARRHSVDVAARSGGHSYGGYSVCRGLVIDVAPMHAVGLDERGTTATVGAGAQVIDIYTQLAKHGRLVPGASCPTVGIAGLALGGGVSVFSRRFGLTCDHVTEVQIVTADGRHLRCDRTNHEDLFWACRGGGGGNFGVVTSFRFRARPIPEVSLFTLQWPFAAASDVLGAWFDWVATAPDEIWSNCQVLSAGSVGGTSVKVTGVFCGSQGSLTGILAPLRAAVPAAPTLDAMGPESYLPAMLLEAGCGGKSVAACHLAGQSPTGTLSRASFAAKSAYIRTALPDHGLTAAVQAVSALDHDVPDVGGGIVFDAYGGAVNRVRKEATAFVHRDALACAQWSVFWGTAAPGSVVRAGASWLESTGRALAPYAHGAYQNYIDPTLTDWARAYYGSNLGRLVKVKRKVDPDDFFRFAQSIPTRLGRTGARDSRA